MSKKLTELPLATSADPDDLIYFTDISDTTDSPEGTSKQITRDKLVATVMPMVRVVTAGVQAIDQGTNVITFGAEDFSYGAAIWDNAAKFIAPEAGIYSVHSSIATDYSASSSAISYIEIKLYDSLDALLSTHRGTVANTGYLLGNEASDSIKMAAGDYVQCNLYASTPAAGSNIDNARSSFTIEKIRD